MTGRFLCLPANMRNGLTRSTIRRNLMKTKVLSALIIFLTSTVVYANKAEQVISLETSTGVLEGTLLIPQIKSDIPVALIIAGSGPTDRNGNSPLMKNDSLKMLATELFNNGIASLRYDKRGIGKSRKAGPKEKDLRFDNYINDAKEWIKHLKNLGSFSQVIVIGHSEGSLIGMAASQQDDVEKFVSIAGPGQRIDKTLKEQLKAQPPAVLALCLPIIDKLVKGETADNVPSMLYSLFRPSIQPYMISWIKYDPQKEITNLDKPVLIIQGTTDLQVKVKDAEALATANPKAHKVIITGMNHIMKQAELDRQINLQTYNQPQLPINTELVNSIVEFIK